MADENVIEQVVESSYDPLGVDQAKTSMRELADETEKVAPASDVAAKGVERLTEKLKELVAAAAIIQFFREAYKEAYEMEKSLRQTAGAAAVYGHNVEEAKKKTDEFARELSLLAGVADTEVAEAVGRAYLTTGSLEQGMARAALAADIFKVKGGSLSEHMSMLERVANGVTSRMSRYGITVDETVPKQERAQKVLDELTKKYHGAAKAVDDNALAMDRSHERWKMFQEDVGNQVLPLMVKVKEVVPLAWEAVITGAGLAANWIARVATQFGNFVVFLSDILPKGFKAAKAEYDKAAAEAKKEYDSNAEALLKQAEERLDRRNKIETDAVKKAADTRVTTNKGVKDKEEKDEKELNDYKMALLQSELAATETALTRLEKEYEIYALERKKAGEEILKSGVDVEARLTNVMKIETNKRLVAERKYAADVKKILDQMTDDMKAELDKRLAAEYKTSQVTEHLRHQGLAMAKKMRDDDLKGQVEFGSAVVGIGEEVFGKSKATAIAHGLINAYEAFTKTTAATGFWGIAAAWAVFAMNIAAVAKMAATNPGSEGGGAGGKGFDDPYHDQMAYWGGRKWAGDMISKFSAGASSLSAGWGAGMGGGSSTSNDNRQTINLHMHGVGLYDASSRASASKLYRTMQDVAKNVEGRLVVGRG